MTAGGAALLDTDWQSDEHSDCGNVPQDEWDRMREEVGGSKDAFEVRTLRWRSHEVRHSPR